MFLRFCLWMRKNRYMSNSGNVAVLLTAVLGLILVFVVARINPPSSMSPWWYLTAIVPLFAGTLLAIILRRMVDNVVEKYYLKEKEK